MRCNKNTKEAAKELLKYLPNKYLKKMDSWDGITNKLENPSDGIFVYDKITIIMFKKITPDSKPIPKRQLFGSPRNSTGSRKKNSTGTRNKNCNNAQEGSRCSMMVVSGYYRLLIFLLPFLARISAIRLPFHR